MGKTFSQFVLKSEYSDFSFVRKYRQTDKQTNRQTDKQTNIWPSRAWRKHAARPGFAGPRGIYMTKKSEKVGLYHRRNLTDNFKICTPRKGYNFWNFHWNYAYNGGVPRVKKTQQKQIPIHYNKWQKSKKKEACAIVAKITSSPSNCDFKQKLKICVIWGKTISIIFRLEGRVQGFCDDFWGKKYSLNQTVLIFPQNLKLMKKLLLVFWHVIKHMGRIWF